MSIRANPSLKDRLVAASEKNDQSLSQEAESRLEASFLNEGQNALTLDTLRNPQLAALASLSFKVMKAAAERAASLSFARGLPLSGESLSALHPPAQWLDDPYCYDQMMQAASSVLEAFRPNGDPNHDARGRAMTKQRFLRKLGVDVAYATLDCIRAPEEHPDVSPLVFQISRDLDHLADRIKLPDRGTEKPKTDTAERQT
jgi:hypothetical protein